METTLLIHVIIVVNLSPPLGSVMDLKSLEASLYGDLENDEELLAELAALTGEKPKAKQKARPPAKQVTPEMLNAALKDDLSDIDDEDLENDEELQVRLIFIYEALFKNRISERTCWNDRQ